MSAKVLTAAEAKKANIAIIENGKGTQAVHDVVTALRANRRTGSACTKTKADVTAGQAALVVAAAGALARGEQALLRLLVLGDLLE
ncbi:MAG: hypothetical protein ACKOJB_00605, partial [Chthoniobacterales bacterium]